MTFELRFLSEGGINHRNVSTYFYIRFTSVNGTRSESPRQKERTRGMGGTQEEKQRDIGWCVAEGVEEGGSIEVLVSRSPFCSGRPR